MVKFPVEVKAFLELWECGELFSCILRWDVLYYISTCRCDEMVDVADSKCASSILTPGEKVVAVASLFVYNKIR